MPARIDRKPAARQDLKDHFVYIGRFDRQTARRFFTAAERTFAQLAQMPGLGGLWETANPAFAGMRVWPVRRFKNYLIFYRPTSTGIEVLRVLHASRDLEKIFEAGD